MDPFRLRRIIALGNGVLALALVATGVWWLLRARSDDADAAERSKWMAPSFEQYQREVRGANQPIWPVDENAFQQIVRPGGVRSPVETVGPSVWPFVGPFPPPESTRETRSK